MPVWIELNSLTVLDLLLESDNGNGDDPFLLESDPGSGFDRLLLEADGANTTWVERSALSDL
jgi:hypothetical protein